MENLPNISEPEVSNWEWKDLYINFFTYANSCPKGEKL